MKKSILYPVLLLLTLIHFSCEDVVDIDLNDENPRLVIDAALQWQKGTTGETQTIKLSLTNNFYTNEILSANGATVTVTNSSNTVFNFTENPGTGEYICTNFVPVINEAYTLNVEYQGQQYTATSTLYATPDILYFQQETVDGPSGSPIIQIKFFYQDNGNEDNFYLIKAKSPHKLIPEYGVIEDEFFQGNLMFGFYASDKTESGDNLFFQLQSVSQSYYNYMNKLIAISSTGSGNPFATPPVTLRGNIVNETNEDNYALGYFSLGEVDGENYVVE